MINLIFQINNQQKNDNNFSKLSINLNYSKINTYRLNKKNKNLIMILLLPKKDLSMHNNLLQVQPAKRLDGLKNYQNFNNKKNKLLEMYFLLLVVQLYLAHIPLSLEINILKRLNNHQINSVLFIVNTFHFNIHQVILFKLAIGLILGYLRILSQQIMQY